MHSTPERAVRFLALAWDIVLCSWGRRFTLTVLLSTQVYKWVPANCCGNLTNCGEVTCDGLASRHGEVGILQAASCFRNWDKFRQLSQSWLQGFPHTFTWILIPIIGKYSVPSLCILDFPVKALYTSIT